MKDAMTRTSRRRSISPPRNFAVDRMPRVDAHMHVRDPALIGRLLGTMTRAGVRLGINLSPSREMIDRARAGFDEGRGRILPAPGTYWIDKGLWWSRDDLDAFKAAGCVGTKILCKYQRGLSQKAITAKIRHQAKIGLGPLWLHVVDPPRPGFWQPNFWDCIHEAEKVIRNHSDLAIIMAHGFWLMIDDKGLDVLAGFFDAYPHLYADLSAVYQWWDPPQPSYKKLRDFMMTYRHRLLYGTDGNPAYAKPAFYRNTYRILETRDERLNGFFGVNRKTYIRGLGLCGEALNCIYWWNAARLIPRVRASLGALDIGAP